MKLVAPGRGLPPSTVGSWLPDMDLNHDKQIQSLLCYRYTIGQAGAFERLNAFATGSSRQTVRGADFRTGKRRAFVRHAGLETCDPAEPEVCATWPTRFLN